MGDHLTSLDLFNPCATITKMLEQVLRQVNSTFDWVSGQSIGQNWGA